MIDFYALQSEQFSFLIRLFEEWEVRHYLLSLKEQMSIFVLQQYFFIHCFRGKKLRIIISTHAIVVYQRIANSEKTNQICEFSLYEQSSAWLVIREKSNHS